MAQLFRILDLQMGPRENECMNRYWFYNPTSETLSITNLANTFFDQHVEIMRLVQSVEWEHVAVFAENVLAAGQSILLNTTGATGVVNEDPTPASNAWSYAMKPIGPILKRGGKRIPGVSEGWTDDEVVTPGNQETAVNAMAAAFEAPLSVGGTLVEPAIVRPDDPVDPTAWIVSVVAGAVFRQIGTQVSRKLSRGGGSSLSGIVPFTTGTATPIDRTGFLETNIPAEIATILATRGTVASPSEYTVPML